MGPAAEPFLKADLPEALAERLAAKAHRLYPQHKHFCKMLHRHGNTGRNQLCMHQRHWTAGWLKRERSAMASGSPVTAPGVPKNYPDAMELITADCIKPEAQGVRHQNAFRGIPDEKNVSPV